MTELAVEHRRPPHGYRGRLVLLHGFTQTRRSWDGLIGPLGEGYETITVDAPGHGGSGDLRLDLAEAADVLARQLGAATYVGYSMGGRLALHLAAGHPATVDRLVLVSTSPGIADADERADRRASDERLACSIERDGVGTFLERWLAQPLFAGLPSEAAGVEDRRVNTAAGLASSLRLSGVGVQRSLWDGLGGLTMPVLLVVGERDAKFRGIADRMAQALPSASVEVVAGAGHAVHLERPVEFVTAVRRWLGD